ncbi:MAG TPA: PRC-barrel domain-containing protein [Agromyces mariniharenae]|nr:PRC-barrel domain-containing protein [Agromyces mariniharenae]
MLLSDLLGTAAFDADGRRLGAVIDVRLEISGAPGQLLAATIVTGVLVSPHSRFSTWGYERRDETGPNLIARFQRWLHRGTFLVSWDDVELVDEGRVAFRSGYTARDAMLPRVPDSLTP